MNIILNPNHKAFSWVRYKNIYYRGYFIDIDEQVILDRLLEISNITELKKYIKEIRGCFVILIIKNDNEVWIIEDISRSFPIFYNLNGSIVSDICLNALENKEYMEDIDQDELAGFLLRRNTSNHRTLLQSVNGVSNSEIVVIKDGKVIRESYYNHKIFGDIKDENRLLCKFNIEITKAVVDAVESIPADSRIIIPLSGGYDSRLLLSILVKNGYKQRVIAYTYGIKEDYETNNAKIVAQKLNVEWYYIEYNKDKWKKTLESEELNEYIDYAFQFSSMPHMQDYIALKELTDKCIICNKDVVIPGFCGDFPAGSFIPGNTKNLRDSRSLAEYTFEKHFINTNCSRDVKQKLISKIQKEYNDILIKEGGIDEADRQYEQWCINTRLTMWVLNSLRLYEFFGLKWRIPMWDKNYLDFWYSVDNSLRKNSVLYKKVLFEGIFKELDICIKKPKSEENIPKQNLAKMIIRRILVYMTLKTGCLFYKRNNTNDYNDASCILYKMMDNHRNVNYNTISFHSIEVLWLCQKYFGNNLTTDVLREV